MPDRDQEQQHTAAEAAAAALEEQRQQPPQGQGPQLETLHPIPFLLLPCGQTDWDPSSATVALNATLDGCIVPSEAAPEGARVSYSHLVVLDDFLPDALRQQLLDFLTVPEVWDGEAGGIVAETGSSSDRRRVNDDLPSAGGGGERGTSVATGARQPASTSGPHGGFHLPQDRWERATADMAGGSATWGVRPHVLQALAQGQLSALKEVGARLAALFPNAEVAHLPSAAIQVTPSRGSSRAVVAGLQAAAAEGEASPARKRPRRDDCDDPTAAAASLDAAEGQGSAHDVDCDCFVANAAVEGDAFRYHVDADPSSFPDTSPWVMAYGDYCNGEPGQPLLISLLLYLNPQWEPNWGGDTHFLDASTGTGLFVSPRPCRAVLFDQDLMHRVVPPSAAAGGRPRFSLVWKLALLPRLPGAALCLARPEWGQPSAFGSAARVGAVLRQIAAEARQGQR